MKSSYWVRRDEDHDCYEVMEGLSVFARTEFKGSAAKILVMLRREEYFATVMSNDLRNVPVVVDLVKEDG